MHPQTLMEMVQPAPKGRLQISFVYIKKLHLATQFSTQLVLTTRQVKNSIGKAYLFCYLKQARPPLALDTISMQPMDQP
jgi:hypothetical protein